MIRSLPRGRGAAAAVLVGLLVVAASRSPAQPPPTKTVLTHADYDVWRTATGVTLSRDGKYVAYTILPIDGPGDGEIIVREVASGKDIRIARGGRPGGDPGEAAGATPRPPGAGAAAAAGATGSPRFAPDSARIVFPLPPTKAELDKAKAAKAKADEMPRPVLAIMDLPSGHISARLPYEKAFTVGGNNAGFLLYHKPAKIEPKDETSTTKTEGTPPAGPKGTFPGGGKGGRGFGKKGVGSEPGAAPAPRAVRTFGTELVIRQLATGSERTIADVAEYSLTKDGKLLVYTVASKDPEANGVYALDPVASTPARAIRAGPGRYTRLVWDEKQTRLAYLYDSSEVSTDPKMAPPPRPVGWTPTPTPPKWHAFVWDRAGTAAPSPAASLPMGSGGRSTVIAAGTPRVEGSAPAVEVLGPDAPSLPKGWTLGGGSLGFSADGTRLFVTTAPAREPTPAPAATTPPAEKVDLDIWHWKDGYIQPMQKLRGDIERNRTYPAVVFLDTRQFRQVGDESLQVSPPAVGDWAVGSDDRKYLHLTGYAYPVPRDYSLVNIQTGERKPALTGFGGSASLSPSGKHLLTFDGKDWSTIAISDAKKTNLTAKLPVKFFNEEDDHPAEPPPYGVAGWSTDGQSVLVYDRYDLWKLVADGSSAENLTKTGRSQQIRFRYLNVPAEDDEDEIDRKGIDLTKPLLLAAENLHTRDTGFFRLEPGAVPKMLVMGARRYGPPVKARNAPTYLLTIQTFYDSPDYYTTGPDFHELKRVTDINPTIRNYNWGRAELVHYRSSDGVPLSGVLVKPENFDPAKKYPMVVYIYERLSDTVHQFRLPNVVRGQVINPTFYASNGYLVLMPDIAYKTGAPGQSALKCVLPAIQAVADRGFVDETAIGINGQSWGGYQIAYMVTQTNRFKAAVAGAPVSNMVSAYGGIRWGTGLPRQFQYEKSQSRIGETLWKAPLLYLENSPIFMADRVTTPLLMIHNDQDDAVPWYQGIEYFLALRRLHKECYLLNYNGEPHNLAKKANARDFAVRMFQFYEHHLRGKPAPDWMVKGVPFVDRDKEKEAIKGLLAPSKK